LIESVYNRDEVPKKKKFLFHATHEVLGHTPVGGPQGVTLKCFLDTNPVHLMNHRVLVHEIFVQFLASDLSLDIRDEVLDVLNGLLLLGNEFRHILWRMIAYQKVVEILVADIKNLKKGTKLVSMRH